jgi:hypothetical protein
MEVRGHPTRTSDYISLNSRSFLVGVLADSSASERHTEEDLMQLDDVPNVESVSK